MGSGSRQLYKEAGVSSFGFGGANGHCILQKFVEDDISHASFNKIADYNIPFSVSAQSISALKNLIRISKDRLKDCDEKNINQFCLNALLSRQPLKYRYITQFHRKKDLLDNLIQAEKNYEPLCSKSKKISLYIGELNKKNISLVSKILKAGIRIDILIPSSQAMMDEFLLSMNKCNPKEFSYLYRCAIWSENEIITPAYISAEAIRAIYTSLLGDTIAFTKFKDKTTFLHSTNKSFKEEFEYHKRLLSSNEKGEVHKDAIYCLSSIAAIQSIEDRFKIDVFNKDANLNYLKFSIGLNKKNIAHIYEIITNNSDDEIDLDSEEVSLFEENNLPFSWRKRFNARNDTKSVINMQDRFGSIPVIFVDDIKKLEHTTKNFFPVQNKKDILSILIFLWKKGYKIDWDTIYSRSLFKNEPLILYPFDKKIYWKTNETNLIVNKEVIEEKEKVSPNFIEELINLLGIKGEISTIKSNSLFEFGVDSIVILSAHTEITKKYGNIPISIFFESKNIGDLIGRIEKILNSNQETDSQVKNKPLRCSSHNAKNDKQVFIAGMAGRFPEANNIFEFWENLKNEKDSVTSVPEERWSSSLKDHYIKMHNKDYREPFSGGFIADIDKFDAENFGISPKEALFMDPQERMFLEVTEECLEHAGINKKLLKKLKEQKKRIGVFVGSTFNNYQLILAESSEAHATSINSQTYSIANRVSYIFDFTGPSLVIDTACSSSLYAFHLALNSIRSNECDLAIVGGVNLTLHPSKYEMLIKHGFLSSKGHCNAFGSDGDGYVPAEAIGAVILCRGDIVSEFNLNKLAKVAGSGVSHGGKTNGYTVPDPNAQAQCIENALNDAKWIGDDITYVEAHGTGTLLGDPIEIEGLLKVFTGKIKSYGCYIGSVKSNIGHAEAAAGIVQLIKVTLQLQYKTLVPSLLFSPTYNQYIDFNNSPFVVNRATHFWEPIQNVDDEANMRKAGINSFGAGGVNVHVLVEETTSVPYVASQLDEEQLIVISARNLACLKENIMRLTRYIKLVKPNLHQLALTLSRLNSHKTRFACVTKNIDGLIKQLADWYDGIVSETVYVGEAIEENINSKSDVINELFSIHLYDKVAKLWVLGFNINDSAIDSKTIPSLGIPPRGFIKKRHWPYDTYLPKYKNVFSFSDSFININKECDSQPVSQTVSKTVTKSTLIKQVQTIVSKVLGYELSEINVDKGFFELGMDSLMCLQIISELNSLLSLSLEDVDIFNYNTCETLAQYICHFFNTKNDSTESMCNLHSVEKIDKPDEFLKEIESFFQGVA
ncbi:beta-ketoacyl synthase N-terminal-like domain-containing protein [Rickettsiella endosymbiont of Dermanyssus gallinae]|uniref:beta-ketoacyl synthase N-terminal-like domain-containing protein n=1 Tax=Rickettsiella endosymbiont of Dermanyssus gallinae TaxID=2856608 RepID=UPI001C52D9AA|nr:beta-ketoacyl synthase N-terminal-like domain-containing protein [Rickettsiella endosymbiont of Dermanyssus gallinae]